MSLIKCRKCGGPHVTLKCGKDKQDLTVILETQFPPKESNHSNNHSNNHNNHNHNNHVHNHGHAIDKRKIVTVRMSNLPDDITVPELNELVCQWGKIGRINISAYENKSGFIDFYYMDEAEYFIKALDKTPFDHLILNVEIMEKSQY
jgi:RNA recognition motif-containing protein